jgi:GH18 family chitinase
MLAFTKDTVPKISASLDFFNIMTYDLMNRRDDVTKHHTGIALSLDGVKAYLDNGLHPDQANLGFAFYVKWFKTDQKAECSGNAIGCKTALMEDPVTGLDLGRAGAFAWSDGIPPELKQSFSKALAYSKYDDNQGGEYYWDSDENIWWSWDSPGGIKKKFPLIMEKLGLGGIFAWGLGEDSGEWEHLKALSAAYGNYSITRVKDEL